VTVSGRDRGATSANARSYEKETGKETIERGGERIRGHSNSSKPLFRTQANGKTVFLSGDFRRLNPATGKLAALKDARAVVVSGGKTKVVPLTGAISARQATVGGRRALTSCGKYHVEHTRARFTSGGRLSGGKALPSGRLVGQRRVGAQTHVGGRLRDELHVEGPVRNAGMISWFVVSATKDPETGRLYPQDQEFGTRRHPPHPFLRPALHESRDKLRQNVRRSVKEGFRR
jgi:hypothetical protein